MDQAVKPGEPAPPAKAAPLLTWPAGVQFALGFILIAAIFFLLGRWSLDWNRAAPPPLIDIEREGPALDLNRATRAELRLIPGIGDALAQRVIDQRERHGPFKSVDELRQVSGIGPKTLERLRPRLFVTLESFVSMEDEEGTPAPAKAKPAPRAVTASKKAGELTAPINVNRADQAELQKLPGIGPKLSQRILDERAKAPFKSIDELRRVPGIGPKTLEKLRPHVTIDAAQAVASSAHE
jgi:competence protein ComEA